MVDLEIVQKHMSCRPSPTKSRDFELSSVSVGMCYQDSVKRQCQFYAWYVFLTYKLQKSNQKYVLSDFLNVGWCKYPLYQMFQENVKKKKSLMSGNNSDVDFKI
jgi:hypothetical protein